VVPGSLPPLSEIWESAQSNLRRLPDQYRQLISPRPYPVRISEGVCRMRDRAIAAQRAEGEDGGEPLYGRDEVGELAAGRDAVARQGW
jgi:hypothetical protein